MDALVGLLSGLVGVVLGALLSSALSSREGRIDRTLEMHREFESADMIAARYRASELLAAHPNADYNNLRDSVGRTEMADVWTVTSFYQRLWLSARAGTVQKSLVSPLFGDTFLWWCDSSFRTQLFPLSSERAHHLKQLESWIRAHTDTETLRRWSRANEAVPLVAQAAGTEADPATV